MFVEALACFSALRDYRAMADGAEGSWDTTMPARRLVQLRDVSRNLRDAAHGMREYDDMKVVFDLYADLATARLAAVESGYQAAEDSLRNLSSKANGCAQHWFYSKGTGRPILLLKAVQLEAESGLAKVSGKLHVRVRRRG